jgi:HEAT repeats
MSPKPQSPARLAALLLSALAAGQAQAQTDRGSLEDLLRHARIEREAQREALGGRVQAILMEFESLTGRAREREPSRLRKRLLDLGPEIAPLLVSHIDPGANPAEAVQFRTQQVVQVLRQLRSSAITDALVQKTGVGSVDGRLNALSVLETCPEPERAAPAVRDLYRVAKGPLRTGALLTLARLGGPEAQTILSEALQDKDPVVVGLALRALGEVRSSGVAAQVLELVRSGDGVTQLPALTEYYGSQKDLLEAPEHFIALAKLLARSDAPRDDAVTMLERFADLDLDLRSAVKKALQPLGEHANRSVREAALVLLARAGDKGARRDLLRPYNEKITAQRSYDAVYTQRGDIWYRIQEYSSAIKDYKQAIKLMSSRKKEAGPFVGLARCYARIRKFKDAKDHLDASPLSIARRRELSQDPAFAEMASISKYRSTFSLTEEQ